MTRLNNTLRKEIVKNAIKLTGVHYRTQRLCERRAKLANDVRLFVIGGEQVEKDIMNKFDDLKKIIDDHSHELIECDVSLKHHDNEVQCNFAGMSVDLPYNGGSGDTVYKHLCYSRWNKRVVIERENPLFTEWEKLKKNKKLLMI